MTLADVLALSAALLATCGGLAALFLMLPVLAPRKVARARAAALTSPVGTCLTGLLGTGLGLALAGLAGNAARGPVRLLAFLVVLGLLSILAVGGAAVAGELGRRIASHSGAANPANPAHTALGAAVLLFACLVPLVGWFVVLPITTALLLGAGFRGLLPSPATLPEPLPAS